MKLKVHKLLLMMLLLCVGIIYNSDIVNAEESTYTRLQVGDVIHIHTWTRKINSETGQVEWAKKEIAFNVSDAFTVGSSFLVVPTAVDTGYRPSEIQVVTTSAETSFDPSNGGYSATDLEVYNQYGGVTYEGGKYHILPRQDPIGNSWGSSWVSLEDTLGITHENCDSKCINVVTEQKPITLSLNFYGYNPNDSENRYKIADDKIVVTYGDSVELPKTISSFTGDDAVYNTPNGFECAWKKNLLGDDIEDVSSLFGDRDDATVYLYPTYNPITYNITYDVNGGTLPEGAITTYQMSDEDIALPTPTRTGYEFKGWILNGANIGTTLTKKTYGDVTLVADWWHEPVDVTLYIDPESLIGDASKISRSEAWGTLGTKNDKSVYSTTLQGSGDTLSVKLPLLTAEGCHFVGWYDNAEYAGKMYAGDTRYTLPNENIELYAKWCNHNNTWNAGVVTKTATCKDEGSKTYTCTVCGDTKIEAIPKLTTHTWNDGVVTKAASTTDTGIMTFTCTVCGETKDEIIPVITETDDHSKTEYRNKKAATCVNDGYTGDLWCLTGDHLLRAGEVIPATGQHTYDDGKITKRPTETETGIKTYTCTVCGHEHTESLAKLTKASTETDQALDIVDKNGLERLMTKLNEVLDKDDAKYDEVSSILEEIKSFVGANKDLNASQSISEELDIVKDAETVDDVKTSLERISTVLYNLHVQIEGRGNTKPIVITLDGNGVSLLTSSLIADSQGKVALSTPTREGYTFKGWYTDKSGGECVTDKTVFTQSVTLYAIWEKKQTEQVDNKNGTPTASSTTTETTTTADPSTTQTTQKVVSLNIVTNVKVKFSKKKANITWKKVANAKSYQMQIAKNKKMKKALKKYNVKSTKKTLKLKKGTYYVRVRAVCDNVNGKWSAIKKVKVKK